MFWKLTSTLLLNDFLKCAEFGSNFPSSLTGGHTSSGARRSPPTRPGWTARSPRGRRPGRWSSWPPLACARPCCRWRRRADADHVAPGPRWGLDASRTGRLSRVPARDVDAPQSRTS